MVYTQHMPTTVLLWLSHANCERPSAQQQQFCSVIQNAMLYSMRVNQPRSDANLDFLTLPLMGIPKVICKILDVSKHSGTVISRWPSTADTRAPESGKVGGREGGISVVVGDGVGGTVLAFCFCLASRCICFSRASASIRAIWASAGVIRTAGCTDPASDDWTSLPWPSSRSMLCVDISSLASDTVFSIGLQISWSFRQGRTSPVYPWLGEWCDPHAINISTVYTHPITQIVFMKDRICRMRDIASQLAAEEACTAAWYLCCSACLTESCW